MRRAEARPSTIAGSGLFASESLPAGTPLPDLDRRLVNHSCDPNVGWAGDVPVTLREVPAGAELTLDYATCTADPGFVMMCHCGTYRCRQVVEGTDWQIPQLRRRYTGHWSPEVQRLIDDLPA